MDEEKQTLSKDKLTLSTLFQVIRGMRVSESLLRRMRGEFEPEQLEFGMDIPKIDAVRLLKEKITEQVSPVIEKLAKERETNRTFEHLDKEHSSAIVKFFPYLANFRITEPEMLLNLVEGRKIEFDERKQGIIFKIDVPLKGEYEMQVKKDSLLLFPPAEKKPLPGEKTLSYKEFSAHKPKRREWKKIL